MMTNAHGRAGSAALLAALVMTLLPTTGARAAEPAPETAPPASEPAPEGTPPETAPEAAPPAETPPATGSSAAEAADKLHELAKAAYLEGRKQQAVEYWREAHRLSPQWKYAYNLANTLYEIGQLVDSWDQIREAEDLGIPGQYLDKLGELRSKIQIDLLKDHAYIELTVKPPGAVVLLDGEPFHPPYQRWVKADTSRVAVSHEGYLTTEQTLEHKVGERYAFEITLEQAPAVLVVTGTPAKARIRVDGNSAGRLPATGPILLEAGRHDVHASLKGYQSVTKQIEVKAGQKTHLTFELAEADTGIGLDTIGWVTAGVGVAAILTGGGLLIGAESVASDLNGRNGDATALAATTYDGYRDDFESDKGTYDTLRTAGLASLGVGIAVAGAGVAMIIVGQDDDDEDDLAADEAPGVSPTALGVTPLPGGGAVFGGLRF